MAVRALVVDDSVFFRRRVSEMLASDSRITVVGSAANGVEAVEKAYELLPDVITMDIEMPLMDGITATRKILERQNVPVIMFSSLTIEGARAVWDALEAGAVDYLPKKFDEIDSSKEEVRKNLCEKVLCVTRSKRKPESAEPILVEQNLQAQASVAPKAGSPSGIIVIGASTGGPMALRQLLGKLPSEFSIPILIVQHMPATFTPFFSQRMNQLCSLEIREAQDRDLLRPGLALLAPGGKQMTVDPKGKDYMVRIEEAKSDQRYKPSIDITFDSVAKQVAGNKLAIVLTGMGNDGCAGSAKLKKVGATVWAQDEASSVVYGMPQAVAGMADRVLSLQQMSTLLLRTAQTQGE